MMICHYFSFLIDEIWLGWWNNILLFLFSVLTELNLICGIWAFSIIRDRPLGSRGPGLHFELALGRPGTHHFFGLGEWAGKPVFLSLSAFIFEHMVLLRRNIQGGIPIKPDMKLLGRVIFTPTIHISICFM